MAKSIGRPSGNYPKGFPAGMEDVLRMPQSPTTDGGGRSNTGGGGGGGGTKARGGPRGASLRNVRDNFARGKARGG